MAEMIELREEKEKVILVGVSVDDTESGDDSSGNLCGKRKN